MMPGRLYSAVVDIDYKGKRRRVVGHLVRNRRGRASCATCLVGKWETMLWGGALWVKNTDEADAVSLLIECAGVEP